MTQARPIVEATPPGPGSKNGTLKSRFFTSLAQRWSGQFSFRLTVIIFLAAVSPLILTGWLVLSLSTRSLHELILRQHQRSLDAIAGGIDLFLAGKREKLELLAVNPFVQSFDSPKVEHAFADFLAENHFFGELLLLQAENRLIKGFSRRHTTGRTSQGKTGQSLDDCADELATAIGRRFSDVITHEHIEILADFREPANRRTVLFLLPVRSFADPRRVTGLLAAEALLDGTDLQEILNSFPVSGGDYACLLREDGEILARRGNGLSEQAHRFELSRLPGTDPSGPVVSDHPGVPASRAALTGDSPATGIEATLAVATEPSSRVGAGAGPPLRAFEAATAHEMSQRLSLTFRIDHDGREDLLSVTRSTTFNGLIAFGQPAGTAFRLIARLREHFLLLVLLAVTCAGAASLALARMFAQPVQALTEGLTRIRQGILNHRLPVDGDDDLANASNALNDLAASLQKKLLIRDIWEGRHPGKAAEAPSHDGSATATPAAPIEPVEATQPGTGRPPAS